MYKIELGNGNVIQNVIIEGATCYTQQKIKRSDFDLGLHEVNFIRLLDSQNDESEIEPGVYKNLKLITCCDSRIKPGYVMFQFAHLNEREIRDQMIDARLDFFDMMLENI